MTSTPRTITEDELAEALAELGIRINGNAYFPELARNIFGYIERQREPEYEPGEAYVSKSGTRFIRLRGTDDGERHYAWRNCETGALAVHNQPTPPLRKLVPEAPRPDHAAILAEIEIWASRGFGLANLADRICNLLNGEKS